jgi:hypothetical protein
MKRDVMHWGSLAMPGWQKEAFFMIDLSPMAARA